MAYSGVGTLVASAGSWNGSSASYTLTKQGQISYTITGPVGMNGSAAVTVNFSSNISWTPTPGTVYVSHTMSAQAY